MREFGAPDNVWVAAHLSVVIGIYENWYYLPIS